MLLDRALESALQVLEEEQVRPTVDYADTGIEAPATPLASSGGHTAPECMNLYAQRREQIRYVHRNTKRYKFFSKNYELLLIIYGQLEAARRPELISSLVKLIPKGASGRVDNPRFPTWAGWMSYLPLLLEFCVRTSNTDSVLLALEETKDTTPGVLVMLFQLTEMLSLNFNLFSDRQLEELPKVLENLRQPITNGEKRLPPRAGVRNLGPSPPWTVVMESERIVAAIRDQCKQARFHYLSGSLHQLPNLEVEADRRTVEHFLTSLGFSAGLVNALNQAEAEYTSASTPFDLKNCLGHLRSVMEHLHIEACRAIANATPGLVAQSSFGNALASLRVHGFLSAQEESLAGGLFKVISDQGVHPLFAEREYARLLRNMIIEYGLLFVTVLDKKGVRIS